MASILGAISSVSALATTLFDYFTGGRSKAQNDTISEAEHWKEELAQALQGGDFEHANTALDRLRQLRDTASASRPR